MKVEEADRHLREFQELVLKTERAKEACKSGSMTTQARFTELCRQKVAVGNQIIAAMTNENVRQTTWASVELKQKSTAA